MWKQFEKIKRNRRKFHGNLNLMKLFWCCFDCGGWNDLNGTDSRKLHSEIFKRWRIVGFSQRGFLNEIFNFQIRGRRIGKRGGNKLKIFSDSEVKNKNIKLTNKKTLKRWKNFVAASNESFSVSTLKMRLINITKQKSEEVLWNLLNYTIVYKSTNYSRECPIHRSHLN